MDLMAQLDGYRPGSATEAADVARVRTLVRDADPWSRSNPVHVTGSAFVVHPPTQRVLLRWHERMASWLHVGGHVDPGETDPLVTARREGREETGLVDLVPWPDVDTPSVVHVAVVPVPAGKGEPAHEHADVRYVLATDRPDDIVPERADARLRWLTVGEAVSLATEHNIRVALERVATLLDAGAPTPSEPST